MPQNRNAVTAGIFMLLSVAAAVAIIIGIVGSARFETHYQTRRVSFALSDNVGGLRQGDDVRLGGLKVGVIEKIDFYRQGSMGNQLPAYDAIIADLSIPDTYPITTDAKVGIETSLTGVSSLNISDLGKGKVLAAGDMLVGTPDALTAFRSKLADLGPKLADDLTKAHQLMETFDNAGKSATIDVHGLATDMHARLKQVSDSAQAALDSVHDLLGPSTTDFHTSVANVRDITGNLKDRMPGLTSSAQDTLDKVNNTVTRVQGSVDDVKATISNAKDMTAAARSVVVRNQSRLDEIIAQVKRASDNLLATMVEVRHSPWRVLYKPTPDEMGNLNLYDAARQFADGADNLSDAAQALRDSLKDPNADPAKVQKLYDDLMDQFNKFSETEDSLWKKVKE